MCLTTSPNSNVETHHLTHQSMQPAAASDTTCSLAAADGGCMSVATGQYRCQGLRRGQRCDTAMRLHPHWLLQAHLQLCWATDGSDHCMLMAISLHTVGHIAKHAIIAKHALLALVLELLVHVLLTCFITSTPGQWRVCCCVLHGRPSVGLVLHRRDSRRVRLRSLAWL
jgi:hypothetical protein